MKAFFNSHQYIKQMRETSFIQQKKDKWKEVEKTLAKESKDPDQLKDAFVGFSGDNILSDAIDDRSVSLCDKANDRSASFCDRECSHFKKSDCSLAFFYMKSTTVASLSLTI